MTARNQTASGARKEKVIDAQEKEASTQREKEANRQTEKEANRQREKESNTHKQEEEITNTHCSVCCDYPVRPRVVADTQATVASVETYPLTSKAKEVPTEWYAVLLVEPAARREA